MVKFGVLTRTKQRYFFSTLAEAQKWSALHGLKIFVEIPDYVAVFEIFPGGRRVRHSPTYIMLAKLTPMREFESRSVLVIEE